MAFSESYSEARSKFLNSALTAGARVTSYQHPTEVGPNNESLFLDVARLGDECAKHILVVGSGTHGIEGYAGSAAQINWLNEFSSEKLSRDTGVLFFHAHNPWGFAHNLRATEENVDLNRNFVDFTKPIPKNVDYEKVHAILDQPDWNEAVLGKIFDELDLLRESLGEQQFSNAFNGGQYTRQDGIFFGGFREQWATRTFTKAIQEHLNKCSSTALIDFHTGIGPSKDHIFLCFHDPKSDAYKRARLWWGERAVNREGVTHKVVANYQGLLVDAFVQLLPNAETTAVVVEFGTLPRAKMQRASMAARWLWSNRDGVIGEVMRHSLMDEVRNAFYPNDCEWRKAVLEQSKVIIDHGLKGINEQAGRG